MLDTGLCATATSCRRSSATSVSSSQTQWAATTWASSSPARAAYSIDPVPRVHPGLGDLLADLVQVHVQPRGVAEQLAGGAR